MSEPDSRGGTQQAAGTGGAPAENRSANAPESR